MMIKVSSILKNPTSELENPCCLLFPRLLPPPIPRPHTPFLSTPPHTPPLSPSTSSRGFPSPSPSRLLGPIILPVSSCSPGVCSASSPSTLLSCIPPDFSNLCFSPSSPLPALLSSPVPPWSAAPLDPPTPAPTPAPGAPSNGSGTSVCVSSPVFSRIRPDLFESESFPLKIKV